MYEASGTIKVIFDEQTFPSGFTKREFVVTTEAERYPQDLKFELVKDKCGLIDGFSDGQRITVNFDIRGNEYNGKYFVNLSLGKSKPPGNRMEPPRQHNKRPQPASHRQRISATMMISTTISPRFDVTSRHIPTHCDERGVDRYLQIGLCAGAESPYRLVMLLSRLTLLATALLVLPACGENSDADFKPIFNGTDLTGWRMVGGEADFSVENGEIVGRGKGLRQNSFLRTEKTYSDFDFRFEFKFDDLSGNSGMMFRAEQRDGGTGRVFGYQCEHCNNQNRAWTAGIFDEARRKWLVPYRDDKKLPYTDEEKAAHEAARKAFTEKVQSVMNWDDWNAIRIHAEGRRIQIWLNGVQTVDFTDDGEEFTPEGFFGLQVHSGKSCNVRWRNLRIKEL